MSVSEDFAAVRRNCKKDNSFDCLLELEKEKLKKSFDEVGVGDTALHIACSLGNIIVCNILLKHGADLEAKNRNSITPLHNAANFGRYDCAEILLQYGADVNSRDKEGNSPLHYACYTGCAKMEELFIRHGGDINITNAGGKRCMDMKGMKNIAAITDINDDEYLDTKEVLTVLHDFVPSNKVTKPVELGVKEGEKVFLVKSSKDGGVCGGWALVTRDHVTEGWVPRNFLGLEYEQIRHMIGDTSNFEFARLWKSFDPKSIDSSSVLTILYSRYNPSNINKIPIILEKYKDSETSLFEELMRRYSISVSTFHSILMESIDESLNASQLRFFNDSAWNTDSDERANGEICFDLSKVNLKSALSLLFKNCPDKSSDEYITALLADSKGQETDLLRELCKEHGVEHSEMQHILAVSSFTRPVWEKKEEGKPLTVYQENEDEISWNLADVDMKVALMSFYEVKNVEKVQNVDEILKSFEDDYSALLKQLMSKYNVSATEMREILKVSPKRLNFEIGDMNHEELRRALGLFYLKHNPEKVGLVPAIMREFSSDRQMMLTVLCNRYNVIPEDMQAYLNSSKSSNRLLVGNTEATEESSLCNWDILTAGCVIFELSPFKFITSQEENTPLNFDSCKYDDADNARIGSPNKSTSLSVDSFAFEVTDDDIESKVNAECDGLSCDDSELPKSSSEHFTEAFSCEEPSLKPADDDWTSSIDDDSLGLGLLKQTSSTYFAVKNKQALILALKDQSNVGFYFDADMNKIRYFDKAAYLHDYLVLQSQTGYYRKETVRKKGSFLVFSHNMHRAPGENYNLDPLEYDYQLILFQHKDEDLMAPCALALQFNYAVCGQTIVMHTNKCFQCERVVPNISVCTQCDIARYCSKDCQKADYNAHRAACELTSHMKNPVRI